MPYAVPTDIAGWYIEAVWRLNPEIGLEDFHDRMPLKRGNRSELKVPDKRVLNRRRMRDRRRMRFAI